MADKYAKLAQEALVFLRPRLDTFLHYAKVEMIPPKPSEIGEIGRRVGQILNAAKSGAWRDLTVKDALVNTLVTLEVGCWFFVGECIGKGTLIGYDVRQ